MAGASSAQFDVFSEEQDDLGTAIFGSAVQLPWDPEGRVMLPDHLVSLARLVDQVAFVGLGGRFQLWEPAAHAAQEVAAKARLRQNKPKLLLQRPEGP